jgi:methionyl-tRNA formyltransferase
VRSYPGEAALTHATAVDKYSRVEDAQTFCEKNGIPFKKVPYTNSDATVSLFKELAPDLGLALGNGYIAPRLFNIPKFGMLNIYHELLPQYQNAQSIIWELYNGSADTGYTIHKINRQIDKGEIVFQEKLPILFKDTLKETVSFNDARLIDASAQGLVQVLNNFDHYDAQARPQQPGTSYTTPSIWQFLKIKRQFNKLKSQYRDTDRRPAH